MLSVPGLRANPSTAVGILPQTGRGALRDYEEKAQAMTVLAGSDSSLREQVTGVEGAFQPRGVSDGAGKGDGEPCDEVVCRRS